MELVNEDMPYVEWTRTAPRYGECVARVDGTIVHWHTLSANEIASAFCGEETKARVLFKSLQPEEYTSYEMEGFRRLYIASSIFPIRYKVDRAGIEVLGSVPPGPALPRHICIAPDCHVMNPDTDNILQLYLMLKWNEEYVLRRGNWIGLPGLKAWWALCKRYPLHALSYYALRLHQRVSTLLSSCISRKK